MAAFKEDMKLDMYPSFATSSSGEQDLSGVCGGVKVGEASLDANGEFRTLGVRLETELMKDKSSCDLRADDIFFSDISLTRPIFDKFACGIFSDKLVKLEHLEDNLD